MAAKKENLETSSLRDSEIESFISGIGLAKKYNKKHKTNLKTKDIFQLNSRHDIDAEKFIDQFKINLAMSLATIINIMDPDESSKRGMKSQSESGYLLCIQHCLESISYMPHIPA